MRRGFGRLRSGGGASGPSLATKPTAYSQDFAGITNGTLLRNVAGLAAFNSTSSTNAIRDQMVVSGSNFGATVNNDFNPTPGLFIIGADAGSASHVVRLRVAVGGAGAHSHIVFAATDQTNCAYAEILWSAGGTASSIFIKKRDATGEVSIIGYNTGNMPELDRPSTVLQAGDEVEIQCVGQRAHLFVNGKRISDAAGVDLDTTRAFTKGTKCGIGTFNNDTTVRWDDLYIAPLVTSLALGSTFAYDQFPKFWAGAIGSGRAITLSGTYSGTVPTGIQYRVVNDASGAVVQDWSNAASVTIGGGNFSASCLAPMCDNTTNPRIRIQLRTHSDVDARCMTAIGSAVGIGLGIYGQSNAGAMGQGTGVTPYAASANVYSWNANNGALWVRGTVTGDGINSHKMATQVSAAAGVPVGLFGFGIAGQLITDLNRSGGGLGFAPWWDDLLNAANLANFTSYAYGWTWVQGEAQASGSNPPGPDETSYRSEFDTILSLLRGISLTPNVPVGVAVIGRDTGTHTDGATAGADAWTRTRAILARLVDKTGVHIAGSLFDLPQDTTPSQHLSGDGYVEVGRRYGMSMRKALGYGGADGRGPIITGATRSGATITLAVSLNGAASISGTSLTNYEVSTDNFATTKTISSAAVSGSAIVITLSADPGAVVKVRSFAGMTFGTPTLAQGTYADTTTIPVEPIYTAITSN